MTETTKTILEKYQLRKTREQKTEFINYIESTAAEMGYSCEIQDSRRGDRNIIIGNPKEAEVIFGAHYDTPPVMPMPNLITPKSIPLYLIYQIFMAGVLMFLPAIAVGYAAYFSMIGLSLDEKSAGIVAYIAAYAVLLVALFFIMFGPANKHNANDNTSGVTTIVDIMRDLPPEARDKTAFVLFDLEERGLVGSASFYKKYKEYIKDKIVVNFDCVGEGENLLFVLRRGAREYADLFKEAYKPTDKFSVEVLSRGYVYPSDQANFPLGVGVCALKRTRRGILYMNKIHTARDIVYNEENIEYLASRSVNFAMAILENKNLE